MRYSGGAITRASACIIESYGSGHTYAPEVLSSAQYLVLNRLLDRIFVELPALVAEADDLERAFAPHRLIGWSSDEPDDRCVGDLSRPITARARS